MKITIKKEVMKEMRMPHLQFINKKGKPIVRKNELQQMVCKAQLKVKGKLSKSVTEYIDSNGHHKFEMSTGWYNVAFGHWVEDGLLTRSREEGYKITELGRLFASTDTRAYEIELWKSKFNKEKVRSSNYQDLYLEYRNKYKVLKNQYDEKNSLADEIITQFGEEFAMSDNKGSLQEYNVADDINEICRTTKPIDVGAKLQTYDGNYNSPLKSLPSNSIINNCLSNIQNEIESIKHMYKE
jgi:hypothetical protein